MLLLEINPHNKAFLFLIKNIVLMNRAIKLLIDKKIMIYKIIINNNNNQLKENLVKIFKNVENNYESFMILLLKLYIVFI